MARARLHVAKAARPAPGWLKGGFLLGLVATIGGCQAYSMGNPFLPRARLQATAPAAPVGVSLSVSSDNIGHYKASNDPIQVTISPVAGDISPAVTISSYRVDWYDSNGTPIDPSLIQPLVQGISVYIPGVSGSGGGGASGGGTSSGGTTSASGTPVSVSVVSDSVGNYGLNAAYALDSVTKQVVTRSGSWNQFLTGKVTFFGSDENNFPLNGLSTNFTLRFDRQASGSVGGL